MADFDTDFPTALDSGLDDPQVSFGGPAEHDTHHAGLGAAVVAVERKLGIGTDIITLATDTYLAVISGAPVDYTDGSPPATGEGVYGPGSLVVSTAQKKLYVNTGTKAEPAWTAQA